MYHYSLIYGNVQLDYVLYNKFNGLKGVIAIISYAPLWKTLKNKGITQYKLINEYHISTGTLDSLRKNKSITLNTLQDICKILKCDISDVVEFTETEEKQ
ncbi:MAG: helix-turn-helix transcriptional regulator [Muricomes sp.]